MKILCLITIIGASLMGNVVHQPDTTPEFEEKLVYSQESKPIAPLSEALRDLIDGILDKTFDEAFFQKIRVKEKEEFTGEYTDYWDSGQAKIKAHFINGKVDGHVHGWFPDGEEAFKAFYYENMKVGIHMVFLPEETKKSSYTIARILTFDFTGKLDRDQTAQYHNGRLKTKIRYKHGALHGHTSFYDTNSQCILERDYDTGKLIMNNPLPSK